MANEQYQLTVDNASAITLTMADKQPLNGVVSVANGGTGAATLTGIVKGNGTSAFTAVTAPSGDLVGTTAIQTLTNKSLTAPALGTPLSGTLTSCTGLPIIAGTTGTLTTARGGTGNTSGQIPITNITGVVYGQTTFAASTTKTVTISGLQTTSKVFITATSGSLIYSAARTATDTLTITASASNSNTVNYFIIL